MLTYQKFLAANAILLMSVNMDVQNIITATPSHTLMTYWSNSKKIDRKKKKTWAIEHIWVWSNTLQKKKEKKLEANSSRKLVIIAKVKMIIFSLIIMNGLRNQFVLVNYHTSKGMWLPFNSSPDSAIRNYSYDIRVMTPSVDATDRRSVAYC